MTLTVSQVWGVLGLLFVAIAMINGFHAMKLTDRLKALKVFQDDQVNYFLSTVTVPGFMVPFLTALACCVMMVYVDFQAIAS